jgi:methyl-accepting chemotaxis protein
MSEEKKGPKVSIFQKLLAAMLLVALVPLASVWFVSRENAVRDWTININRQLASTADGLVDQVDNWVDLNRRLMEQNAQTGAIRSMDKEQQDPVLRSIKGTYEWVNLAFTVDPQGNNIGRSDNRPPNPPDSRPFFKAVMKGDPLGHQVVMGITSGKPALILGAPIHGDDPNHILGVIAMGMTLEKLSNTITTIKIGDTGFAFLLDEHGKVIGHPQLDMSKERQDFSKHPAFLGANAGDSGHFVYEENGKKIVAYTRKTKMGWNVVVQQDYDEAFAPVRAADFSAMILLAVTLLAAILVAYIVSRRFTTPILGLTAVANEMSRGKLDLKIAETARRDEIGDLAHAIERMGTSIRLAMERLRKKD